MLPPGLSLADDGSHSLGMPMKVEVGGNLSQPHQSKNKSVREVLAALDKFTQKQQQAPTTMPSSSASVPGLHAGASKSDFGPLGELLEKVLVQVARDSPPEDTKTVCEALARSLTPLIMQNSTASARMQETDQNSQMMQILQEVERQRLIRSHFAQNQAQWQQGQLRVLYI